MNVPDFLDTTILVHAYGSGDDRKRTIAQGLVTKALLGELVISTQVLAEFSSTLLRKSLPPVKPAELASILDVLEPIRLINIDFRVVRRAVEANANYGVPFYDGMILAAAERGGCRKIWSDDLEPGQRYFGMVVENPFV